MGGAGVWAVFGGRGRVDFGFIFVEGVFMTLTQFIKNNLGKKIDYDKEGTPQCVDLARLYFDDVLEVPQFPPLGINGGAKDIFYKCDSLKKTPDSALADYSRGDVLIWGPTDKNPYGHVAILVAIYNTKYFIVFEQDGFKKDGAKLAFRCRENLLGCLYKI